MTTNSRKSDHNCRLWPHEKCEPCHRDVALSLTSLAMPHNDNHNHTHEPVCRRVDTDRLGSKAQSFRIREMPLVGPGVAVKQATAIPYSVKATHSEVLTQHQAQEARRKKDLKAI